MTCDWILGDKGYDPEAIIEPSQKHGAVPVIPRSKCSKVGNDPID
jgi:hypothetical protein